MYTKTKILTETDTKTESFRSLVKSILYFHFFFLSKTFHAQCYKDNLIKLLFDLIGHCLGLELTESKNDVIVGIDENIVPCSSHLGSYQGTIVLPALPIVWLSKCPVSKVEGNMARLPHPGSFLKQIRQPDPEVV